MLILHRVGMTTERPGEGVVVGVGGGVPRRLERRNLTSEGLGFDPWWSRVRGSFFCPSESALVQTCLCLNPLSCVRHAPKCVRMLKIPYPSDRHHSWWYENTKTMRKRCTMAARFPQEKQSEISLHCIGTRMLSNLI